MNYKSIYDKLITRAKMRIVEGYTETHHIIPKCMEGSDCSENLVELTPEEHYLAHQLLVKIYPDNYKLKKAAVMMIANRPSNKLYGWIRRRFAEGQSICQSGERNSQYGTMWICNGIKEKKIHTHEEIPIGWNRGRLYSQIDTNILNNADMQQNDDRLLQIIKRKKEKYQQKIDETEKKKQTRLENLKKLHEIYKIEGFEGVKMRGYEHTQPSLVMAFAKYLPDFIPQNGKKRKK